MYVFNRGSLSNLILIFSGALQLYAVVQNTLSDTERYNNNKIALCSHIQNNFLNGDKEAAT